MTLDYYKAGIGMLARNFRKRKAGFVKHKGNHIAICQSIIKACYNKNEQYFMTSVGNYPQFYMRDFGLCVDSLMHLGYSQEVHRTLQYALSAFSRHRHITTNITPEGKPVNVFSTPSDSLPFLIRSLRLSQAYDLIEAYKPFLDEEILKYKEDLLDNNEIIKKKTYFSTIKDGYKRNSSCYDNACVALLQKELQHVKLRNPFIKDHKRILLDHWNGSYFYDDLDKKEYIAGDANTFPFYFDIITDATMRKKAIDAIRHAQLDKPLPLKYTNFRDKKKELWQQRLFSPNYEGTTVWLHLGLAYLSVIAAHDKKLLKTYLDNMREMIERYKTFPEVLNPDGTPYCSAFYYCDEGMLWAAMYLDLISGQGSSESAPFR